MKRLLPYSTVAFPALLLVACEPANDLMTGGYLFKPSTLTTPARISVADGYWDNPGNLQGHHVIVIDTEIQKAKYYINGHQVGYSDISSGKAGHGTPKGEFTILSKDKNHKSSTYGSIVDSKGNTLIADYTAGEPMPPGGIYKGAAMNFGMQITKTGIWMHEGIVTSAPESHGCIRLPRRMAEIFFDNTPVGSTVIIK